MIELNRVFGGRLPALQHGDRRYRRHAVYWSACAFLLGALSLSASAAPNLYIGTVYDYLDAAHSSHRKRVTNTGDTTAFVRVDVFEIFYGNGAPTEIALNAPTPAGQRQGLIATPSRLIIPPKGTQASRLLFIGDRDRERYYRVRFIPIIPEKEDAFALSPTELAAYKASLNAGVNVFTGFGTIVIVRPTQTRFDTRIDDTAAHYRVINAGNSTVVLEAFKSCSSTDESACEPSRIHHVMPGKTFSVTKTPGRIVHFNRVEGDATHPTQVNE
jgi:hypothetical protein